MFLIAVSCSPNGETKKMDDVAAEQPFLPDALVIEGDSVVLPSFKILVKLSEKAESKLKKDNETVIVQCYFSGIPKDTTREEYLDEGRVPVGTARRELRDGRTATFDGCKILRTDFESLANPDFEILVNIFSGRRSTDVNILDCEFLQDSVSHVKGRQFVLTGRLSDEKD
jgi:hypothetical protein